MHTPLKLDLRTCPRLAPRTQLKAVLPTRLKLGLRTRLKQELYIRLISARPTRLTPTATLVTDTRARALVLHASHELTIHAYTLLFLGAP